MTLIKWAVQSVVVLALLGLLVLEGRAVLERRLERATIEDLLAQQPIAPPAFELSMIADLPEPARRYFAFAIAPGTPLWSVAEIEMHGTLRLGIPQSGRELEFTAYQVLAAPQGFVWQVRSRFFGLPLIGSDMADGTRIRWLGFFPVVRDSGSADHRRSAFGRYVAEAVLWTPAAVLPGPGVTWRAIDDDSAAVTVSHRGLEQTVYLMVDAAGQPLQVAFERWSNANPERRFRKQPFGGVPEAFRDVEGFHVPHRVVAVQQFGTDEAFAFFEAEVDAIRFPRQ